MAMFIPFMLLFKNEFLTFWMNFFIQKIISIFILSRSVLYLDHILHSLLFFTTTALERTAAPPIDHHSLSCPIFLALPVLSRCLSSLNYRPHCLLFVMNTFLSLLLYLNLALFRLLSFHPYV